MTPHLVVSQLGSYTIAIIISHEPSQHTEAGLDHPGLSFAAIPYKASAPKVGLKQKKSDGQDDI